MAKKKVIEQPKQRRVLVFTKDYEGYLDEMPEDLRVAREARLKKK